MWKKNFKTESSTLTTALESTTKSGLLLWSHPDRKIITRESLCKGAALPEAQYPVGAQAKLLEHLRGWGLGVQVLPESTSAGYSVLPTEDWAYGLALRHDSAARARERM